MLLRFRPDCSPNQWVFEDPDTGHKYLGKDKLDLVKKIVTYREQNELEPLFQLGMIIDNYLCAKRENLGKCRPVPELDRSWTKMIRGGVVVLKNWLFPKIVNEEVARLRSEICIKCPYNAFPEKKKLFVEQQNRIAEKCAPGKKTEFHEHLGVCEICTCPLRAKVHYGGKIDLADDEYERMPEFCWQKKEFDAQRRK